MSRHTSLGECSEKKESKVYVPSYSKFDTGDYVRRAARCGLQLACSGRSKAKKNSVPPAENSHFHSPIDTARTIQVHEVLSEAQKSEQGLGRLVQTATLTIRFQAGYNAVAKLDTSRYRIDMTESNPPEPASYNIFDGKQELVVKRGKVAAHETTEELNNDPWAAPLDEFIESLFEYHHEHTQQAITAVLAMRNGQRVLATGTPGDSEDWYDPKTHLLIRRTEFESQFGEKVEFSRTVYSGWVLNAPLPASTFAFPPGVPIPVDVPCPCPPVAGKRPAKDQKSMSPKN